MKSNTKGKKPKITQKLASSMFCNIIDSLLKRYEKCDEKELISFKQYCLNSRDKGLNTLSSQIVDTLVARYEESEEKKTMSFKAYCIGLRDLSNKAVGKDVISDIDTADEENQKKLEEGEKHYGSNN